MEQRKLKWREPASAAQVDQLLASRYGQLMQWASGLTRGDAGKSEEIVQEFCLYFTLTRPDLSAVVNLDGYLYTSLRHIYLSGLARSSREALRFVSVAEFDCFASALDDASGDALQKQNDLRRICAYTVWRKESSKSASYFILHFFHGYGRREIAELGCVPMAAIYNKLKIARSEVKSHLKEAGKLRIVHRDLPPEPTLSWSLSSSEDLFRELRKTILDARNSNCPGEEELLAYYRASTSRPAPCALLAHIVSCEPCLNTVDRYLRRPTLKDREPLDCFGLGSEEGSGVGPGSNTHKETLQAVRKRWGRVHEHRPRTLSIAVNGQIVAFHDVQAEHSKLSARIERPENAMFVEVFSEQDVRLALLSIGDLPPDGSRVRTQRVELSDARWLELSLTFDGLGLNGEVAYFDPALAADVAEEDAEESLAVLPSPRDGELATGTLHRGNAIYAAFRRLLLAMTPSSALGWSFSLAVFLTAAGYFIYHRAAGPAYAMEILNQSVTTETAALQGQTEHQVLNIQEVSSKGAVLQRGVVDLWKDGDGNRYLRRLFDAKHRMVAAEWRNRSGEHHLHRKDGAKATPEETRPLLMSGLWDHDLSAQAFRGLGGRAPRVRPVEEGYELTTAGPIEGHPQVISATLVLDRHLVPIRTVLRVQSAGEVHELRFVQASYERRPRASVPDGMFDPEYFSGVRDLHATPAHPHPLTPAAADFALAELQIAVLYQLNRLQADSSQPIEVMRTSEGRIRVSGAPADEALRRKIIAQLQALPNHDLLELKLFSPQEVRRRSATAPRLVVRSTSVYEINQEKSAADETLRKYFQAKGMAGERLDAAVGQFSHDALEHAQRALQNAFALDRLGGALSTVELQSIDLPSQQRWTEMIDKHAQTLEEQLRMLDRLLAEISEEQAPGAEHILTIADPAQFKQAAGQLLRQTQDLNRDVGAAFTSTPSAERGQGVQWPAMVRTIPLHQAEEVARFGVQLHASAAAAKAGNVPR